MNHEISEPELYGNGALITKRDFKNVLDKYRNLLNWKIEKEIVLDLGCGDGGNTVQNLLPNLPKSVHKIVGCDISEAMLEWARKTHRYPNLEFTVFDITSDTIPTQFKNVFGHIFSSFCLHCVRDQRKTMKNIFDMLQPGGQILLIFLEYKPVDEPFEKLSKYEKWALYDHKKYLSPGYRTKRSIMEWEQFVHEAGFVNIDFQVEKLLYVFPDEEIFRELFISVNPFISTVPSHDRSEYINDYLTESKNSHMFTVEYLEDGTEEITMQYNLISIFASKLE